MQVYFGEDRPSIVVKAKSEKQDACRYEPDEKASRKARIEEQRKKYHADYANSPAHKQAYSRAKQKEGG